MIKVSEGAGPMGGRILQEMGPVRQVGEDRRSGGVGCSMTAMMGGGVSRSGLSALRAERSFDRLIFFGIGSLTRALAEFVDDHDLRERNHQGIGNELIETEVGVGADEGVVCRRDRLGGLPIAA